jgi:outer membrane murein-binding lipoprotein Lpp
MSDPTKALDSPRLNTLFSAVAAFAAVLAVIGVLNGWMSSGSLNSKDISQLRDNLAVLGAQVANLSVKLEQTPRLDQLQTINGHLSALDGRMDGMDTRSRADEDRLTRTETLVGSIDEASRAKLGAGRR